MPRHEGSKKGVTGVPRGHQQVVKPGTTSGDIGGLKDVEYEESVVETTTEAKPLTEDEY
jgi:hypothetical protein